MLLQDTSGLAQGIGVAGNALAQALQEASKRRRLQDILQPMASMTTTQPSSTLGSIVGQTQEQTTEMNIPQQQEVTPVADQLYNQKMAQINYRKQQAAALEGEGYHPQAQMMMQEAHQQEQFLQQERLQEKLAQQKFGQQRTLAKEQRAFKSNEGFFNDREKLTTQIPLEEANLYRINQVLESGDLNTWRNFGADYLAQEGFSRSFLQSASANELDSAVKDQFVQNLKETSTNKLNQYLERNIRDALQNPLKSPANNRIITESQQFKIDIEKKKLDVTEKLLDAYDKMGVEPPSHLSNIVNKELSPYIDERLKEFTQKVKDINSGKIQSKGAQAMSIAKKNISGKRPSPGSVFMLSPDGDIKEVPLKMVIQATAAGGSLIK